MAERRGSSGPLPADLVLAGGGEPRRYCPFFRRGTCRRGDACRDIHQPCALQGDCPNPRCVFGHPREHRLDWLTDDAFLVARGDILSPLPRPGGGDGAAGVFSLLPPPPSPPSPQRHPLLTRILERTEALGMDEAMVRSMIPESAEILRDILADPTISVADIQRIPRDDRGGSAPAAPAHTRRATGGATGQGARRFRVGDRARVIADVAEVRRLQVGHGGFNEASMPQLCGTVGVVTSGGGPTVRVRFPNGTTWAYNVACLESVLADDILADAAAVGGPMALVPRARVRVIDSVEEVQRLAEGHGGWNAAMAAYSGREGIVEEVDADGDISVIFADGNSWTYHPQAVRVVGRALTSGMRVRVLDSVEEVQRLAVGHGEWTEPMGAYCGQEGVIRSVGRTGDLVIRFTDGRSWTYNPAAVRAIEVAGPEAGAGAVGAPLAIGMTVRVIDGATELERLSEGHGDWVPEMAAYCGREGVIEHIYEDGDLRVRFPDSESWTLNPLAVRAVGGAPAVPPGTYTPVVNISQLRVGMPVRVSRDEALVRRLAPGHGGWTTSMATYMGADATIDEMDDADSTVHIRFADGRRFWYHPQSLEVVPQAPAALFGTSANGAALSLVGLSSIPDVGVPVYRSAATDSEAVATISRDKTVKVIEIRPDFWAKIHPSVYADLEGSKGFKTFDAIREGFVLLAANGVRYWRLVDDKNEDPHAEEMEDSDEGGVPTITTSDLKDPLAEAQAAAEPPALEALSADSQLGLLTQAGEKVWCPSSDLSRLGLKPPAVKQKVAAATAVGELVSSVPGIDAVLSKLPRDPAALEVWAEKLLPFLKSAADVASIDVVGQGVASQVMGRETVDDIKMLRTILPLSGSSSGSEHLPVLLENAALLETSLNPKSASDFLSAFVGYISANGAMDKQRRGSTRSEAYRLIALETPVTVSYHPASASSSHPVRNLANDRSDSFWETNGSTLRRVTVRVPPGKLWCDFKFKPHDYNNYSPENVTITAKVGGIEKVRKTFQRLPRNGGWFTLLAAQEIGLEPEKLLELGCDLEFAIDRNYDDGINSRVNCLRVFAGKRLTVKTNEPQTFAVRRTMETFEVTRTGQYGLAAKGGRAANGRHKKGGRGAVIEASFRLMKGDKLDIMVGEASRRRDADTGGGGGTFVWVRKRLLPGLQIPLIVAGGGGGTRGYEDDTDGQDASLDTEGKDGKGPGETHGKGGVDGGDGKDAGSYGGGGRGIVKVLKEQGRGTEYGGFGGGGNAGRSGGGGGGGYSGGGGGRGAGGGGSFVAAGATNVNKFIGGEGDGTLMLTPLRVDPDLSRICASDKVRLALMRRAMRVAVALYSLVSITYGSGKGVDAERLTADVRAVVAVLRDRFDDTLFAQHFLALWRWALELRMRGLQSMWLSSAAHDTDPETLQQQWALEDALNKKTGLGEEALQAARAAYVEFVVRGAFDRDGGRWIGEHFNAYVMAPDPFGDRAQAIKSLINSLMGVADDAFKHRLASTLGESFARHLQGLLARTQTSRSALELSKGLKSLLGAFSKAHLLTLDDEPSAPLWREISLAGRAAWRSLSRSQAADVAELLCLAANKLLDPSRSDTSTLAKGGWRASLEELGLLVRRLGCEADLVWFYEHLLAKRLLRGRTLGSDAEARACDILQLALAAAQRVDGMLRDLDSSEAVNKAFLAHVFSSKCHTRLRRELRARLFDTSYGEGGAFFNVTVISVGRFPPATVDKGPLVLPTEVAELLEAFQAFYVSDHPKVPSSPGEKTSTDSRGDDNSSKGVSRRRLTLFPRAGSVVLTYTPQQSNLFLSPTQASVLLALWNNGNATKPRTLREAAIALNLADARNLEFLRSELDGLCMATSPVLRLAGTDTYALNEQYLQTLAEGSLLVVHTYQSSDSGPQDVDRRVSQALGWRLEVVEAAAVKIAKRDAASVPMPLSAFTDAVVTDVQPFFACTRRDVLAAINDLVSSGYLCRTPSAGATCPYQLGISYNPPPETDEVDLTLRSDRGFSLGSCSTDRDTSRRRSSSLSWMGDEFMLGMDGRLDSSGHGGRGTSIVFCPSLLRKVGEVDYGRSPSTAGTVLGMSWCFDVEEAAVLQAQSIADDAARRVAEVTGLERSSALRLVWQNGWDVDKTLEKYLAGPSQTLEEARLPPRRQLVLKALPLPEAEEGEECNICFANTADIEVTRCGHRFCSECVIEAAKNDIERHKVPLTCCFATAQGRCESAITATALERYGFGRAEVLVWPLPIVVDAKEEAAAQQELLAEVARLAGADEMSQPSVKRGNDRMDYAVLTFSSQMAADAYVRKSRDAPMTLGGQRVNVQAGGWKAILGLVAAQDVLTAQFVSCANPVPCRGRIYLGLSSRLKSTEKGGSCTVHCRRCDYVFCSACKLGDHTPVPCSVLRDWEGEGGSSIQSREDLETKKLLYDLTKRCPKCSTHIEKDGGCLHMTCRTKDGTRGCGYEFCWRCFQPWQRDTHPDFYSCSLPMDKTARGAQGQFERFDKLATAHIATYIRIKGLQRTLHSAPQQAPQLLQQSSSVADDKHHAPSDLDAYLRSKILSALEQGALFLYSTTVARYFIPQRLKTVHRRLLFETAPLEKAVRSLLRAVDASDAVLGPQKSTKAVVAELVALRFRLDSFREELTPLVVTALAQTQAGDPDVADDEQSVGERKAIEEEEEEEDVEDDVEEQETEGEEEEDGQGGEHRETDEDDDDDDDEEGEEGEEGAQGVEGDEGQGAEGDEDVEDEGLDDIVRSIREAEERLRTLADDEERESLRELMTHLETLRDEIMRHR